MPHSSPRGRADREPLWRHLLGGRLRELRHRRGETLGRTAARAGVSPQYLSELERGMKEPSSEVIAAVASALGVTLVDLVLAVVHGVEPSRDMPTSPVRAVDDAPRPARPTASDPHTSVLVHPAAGVHGVDALVLPLAPADAVLAA